MSMEGASVQGKLVAEIARLKAELEARKFLMGEHTLEEIVERYEKLKAELEAAKERIRELEKSPNKRHTLDPAITLKDDGGW